MIYTKYSHEIKINKISWQRGKITFGLITGSVIHGEPRASCNKNGRTDNTLSPQVLVSSGPVYVVGEATGELARRELACPQPVGGQAGCAQALAAYIIQHHADRSRPLLFPCGDQARVGFHNGEI